MEYHELPIGIANTIKDLFGMEVGIYKETSINQVYALEKHGTSKYLIAFDNSDKLAEYFEFLVLLGIFCKINSCHAFIIRNAEIEKTKDNIDNYYKIDGDSKIDITIGRKKFLITLPELINYLKEEIKEKMDKLSIDDIMQADLSQFEIRKMIAIQYSDIELDHEEILALSYYKAGYDDNINGFLQGDLTSFHLDSERALKVFYQEGLSKLVDMILKIYQASLAFTSTRNLYLLCGINHCDSINLKFDSQIGIDSFISTNITSRIFNYNLEGSNYQDFVLVQLPKDSHFIPMDIINERRKNNEEYLAYFCGSIDLKEGEYLLPMCEAVVTDNDKYFKEGCMLTVRIIKQKDVCDVLRKRIIELEDNIIKYNGIDFYNELLYKINSMGVDENVKKLQKN